MWFFGQLSRQEVGDYLSRVSRFELSGVVSCVVLQGLLSDKGKRMASKGKKILAKHAAIFRGCSSGADIGSAVERTINRWPDVSTEEFVLLSDIVKAHKSLNPATPTK